MDEILTYLFIILIFLECISSWQPLNLNKNKISIHNKHIFNSNVRLSAKRTIRNEYLDDIESIINIGNRTVLYNDTVSIPTGQNSSDRLLFPEIEQAGIDEKALRQSIFGKILFPVLETLFPVFKEPNWFDVYDPPLTAKENLDLPYFDGYDFANSSWTIYIRHRYGVWNWLDRLGLVPMTTNRVFLRNDGKTVWSDGFYGDWYINPAINYLQIGMMSLLFHNFIT